MLVLLQSGVGRFRWFLLLLRHNSMRSACVSVRLCVCVCVCVCIEQQLNAKFLTSARAATNKKCGDARVCFLYKKEKRREDFLFVGAVMDDVLALFRFLRLVLSRVFAPKMVGKSKADRECVAVLYSCAFLLPPS